MIDIRNGFRKTRDIFLQKAFDPYRGEQMTASKDVNVDNDDELDAGSVQPVKRSIIRSARAKWVVIKWP